MANVKDFWILLSFYVISADTISEEQLRTLRPRLTFEDARIQTEEALMHLFGIRSQSYVDETDRQNKALNPRRSLVNLC